MTTLLQRWRAGEALTDLGIIDMHGHLGRFQSCIPELSPRALVDTMDRLGIDSTVCSSMQCMSLHVEAGNNEVANAMQAFPGRILGYTTLWPGDREQARAEAERCFDLGFVGLKLHDSNGFAYTDSAYAGALELADRDHRPVLLHTYGLETEFAQVRELAATYGQAQFIMAHAGANEAEETCGELARTFGNVHFELCRSAPLRGAVERLVAAVGAERVLWGSDAIFLNPAHQFGKLLGAPISDKDKIRILSTNARRILDGVRGAGRDDLSTSLQQGQPTGVSTELREPQANPILDQ